MSTTKLFQRNRALGYVCNHVPASIRFIKKRKENVIVTCVGRAFHVYSCSTFRLICVSPAHSDDIGCVTSDSYYIYSACGTIINAWRLGKVLSFQLKGHEKRINLMLPFGKHLISIDESSCLKIWDIESESAYLEIPFANDQFKISAILHPATYINKILLGSEQGKLQLWNIKECKMIHNFKQFNSEIMILEQAPALDVAAIGLKDGKIILLNLKYEEVVMEFAQDWGPVTGIGFRTDNHPIMATSSTNGKIIFWNLEEKKIVNQLRAHKSTIKTLQCLPSEPLLITTSPENSMKLWIFDMPDGGARLLKERQGHGAPPTFIRFHGSNGQNILSASEDRTLRIFSTVTEMWNKSFGEASYNKTASKRKNRFEYDRHIMPRITQFTSETTREKEWDSIGAIHAGLVMTTTWSFHKCKMGELKLVPPQFVNSNPEKDFSVEATCVCLTHCGNFILVGYSKGDVERFNIQSGIHRMTYGKPAHDKCAVKGIATDLLNQTVVTAGSDGWLKFWNFKANCDAATYMLDIKFGVTNLNLHRESSMLCVALEDFSLNIIDLDTRVIVRKFKGHTAQITDVAFSNDSRWLISAAMDCSIKVWDIPSSYLIEHFKTNSPCISLTMSPTGQYLATTHTNDLGVCLWTNKSLYNHVSLRAIDPKSEPPLIELPTSQLTAEQDVDIELAELNLGEELDLKYNSPTQLDNLLTMSAEATSKWQNILNLDIIKKRNKPKEPLKVPKQAPFFLPTVMGSEVKFDLSDAVNPENESRILISSQIENTTSFGKQLKATKSTNDFEECIRTLLKCGPTQMDVEIKSLSPHGGGSIEIMEQFFKMIISMLETNTNFEFAQAYLALLLRNHSEDICTDPKLSRYLEQVEVAQNRGWNLLEENLLYGIGVINSLRNYTS